MIQLSPFALSNFLSVEECLAVRGCMITQDMKGAKLSGAQIDPSVRSAQALWLEDDTFPWLTKRLARKVSQITNSHFSFRITGLDEGYQLLKYQCVENEVSGDFYDWHMDIGRSGLAKSRKLTMIIQLSNSQDYSGGDLEVNYDGTPNSMDKNIGTLIAFPSFALHRVTPISKGERLSLAIWAHGPAFQ